MSTEAPSIPTDQSAPSTNGHPDTLVGRARTRLRAYLSDHEDVSQNGVSRSIGRGQSTISQFLKDTYNGDNEAVARDVLDWLQRERERAARPSIGDQVVVETSAYKRIQSVVRLTHEERDIGVVIGEAGLGKTLALQAYEADHERSVMRLEVGPEYRSRGLALELSRRCGGPDGGSIYKLMQAVYDELAGTDRLVIVDQAEILPTRGLELCRRLHDVCNIGVVLAGMPRLLANLQGSRGELKQLYSRVGFKARVEELSDEDVHLLVQAFTPGAEDGTVTAVAELTRNTRVATKILKRARHVAELNDTPVGPELIEHGQRMLVIPDPEGRS